MNTQTIRHEVPVNAKQAVHDSMPDGHLCGCDFIADRLLSKSYVIRKVEAESPKVKA